MAMAALAISDLGGWAKGRRGPPWRQTELTDWLAKQRDRQETVGELPTRVRSFLKDWRSLGTRRAKALLQSILASANVYNDGRIELEFFGSEPRLSISNQPEHFLSTFEPAAMR